MPKCPHCQSEQSGETEFCTKCGTRLKGLDVEDSTKKPDPSYWATPENTGAKEKEETNTNQEKNTNPMSKDDKNETDQDKIEKDPFEVEFDENDTKNKKSSDGIWLAIIAVVVVVAIIIVGTTRNKSDDKEEEVKEDSPEVAVVVNEDEEAIEDTENQENTEEINDGEEENKEEPAPEPEPAPTPSGPGASASSVQKDTSVYKFDYSASQVLDNDFSTGWIESDMEAGIGEWIEVNFGEEKEFDKLGIVPGFGRDEEIYQENNRIKEMTLEFGDGTTIKKELEDKYGMQIIEFDKVKTDKVKITIEQVYSGTKYNDTSISEIDIDSDYVTNNDPDGALSFYLENKKGSAKKPN
ncbi:discoidin domain-containing protein [Patescibacteria group bacterium]|nr:discoidin domain-containing protein [Patescibacteria group bacterium]